MTKTKIIGTYGPSLRDNLKEVIDNNMLDGVICNLKWMSSAEAKYAFELIDDLASAKNQHIPHILSVPTNSVYIPDTTLFTTNAEIKVVPVAMFDDNIYLPESVGNDDIVVLSLPDYIYDSLAVNDVVTMTGTRSYFVVKDKCSDYLTLECCFVNAIPTKVWLQFPDTSLPFVANTNVSKWLNYAGEYGADYVLLTGIHSLEELKHYLAFIERDVKVIIKIDNVFLLEDLEATVNLVDGYMLNIDNFGNKVPLSETSRVLKDTLAFLNANGKISIVNTKVPTRGNVLAREACTDIANAVSCYCSAICLSGVSATGDLMRILPMVKDVIDTIEVNQFVNKNFSSTASLESENMCVRAAVHLANTAEYPLFVFDYHDDVLPVVMCYAPGTEITVFSENYKTCRQYNLYRNVTPVKVLRFNAEFESDLKDLSIYATSYGHSKKGDTVICLAQSPYNNFIGHNCISCNVIS